MTVADQVIAALRAGHDDLCGWVATLDEKDLLGPSGAREWDVAHVLSHLGSGAVITLAGLERSLAGVGKAPEGFNQSVWDAWNAMEPPRQRDSFIEANQRLVEAYEGLDAATRESLQVDVGFLPAPISVADAGGLRLTEFTLHAWDIRVGTDASATLAPEAVPLLLDGMARLVGWIARPQVLNGRRAELVVQLTDPQRAFGLLLGDAVSIVEPSERPDGVLRAPAEAWPRLVSGRLAPEVTPAGVDITGPVTLDDLRRVFPGY